MNHAGPLHIAFQAITLTESNINSIVAGFAAIAVAWFGFLGVRAQVRRVRARNAEEPEQTEAIQKYEDDPAQFVRDVLSDNQRMRDENKERDEKYEKLDKKYTQISEEVSILRDKLRTREREDEKFRDALARWLSEIFASWGIAQIMPMPRASDRDILHTVIPQPPAVAGTPKGSS